MKTDNKNLKIIFCVFHILVFDLGEKKVENKKTIQNGPLMGNQFNGINDLSLKW